jgi:hypothetical protein
MCDQGMTWILIGHRIVSQSAFASAVQCGRQLRQVNISADTEGRLDRHWQIQSVSDEMPRSKEAMPHSMPDSMIY